MKKNKMQKRSTYKWWKELYELLNADNKHAVLDYVFQRLDKGTFRSQTNSSYNMQAIEYILREATRKPTAIEYAQKEVSKWEKS